MKKGVVIGGLLSVLLAFGEAAAAEWRVSKTSWSAADEEKFGEFVRSIGESDCNTVTSCLAGSANPYRSTDPKGLRFVADCADLPYLLRGYFAWKMELPFTYVNSVYLNSAADGDPRFSKSGNRVGSRTSVKLAPTGGGTNAVSFLKTIRNVVSSATFRTSPEFNRYPYSDFYSPEINRESVRAGTVIYDINGHVAVVYKVGTDGRIYYIDAHPDNTLTRSIYGRQIPRTDPELGAGFKNWRPVKVINAERDDNGTVVGGKITLEKNENIPDHSTVQYFGTEPNPDENWELAEYTYGDQAVQYYEFVRHAMADGDLVYDPIFELRAMMQGLCQDIQDRGLAVDAAIRQGIHQKPAPDRLPDNIYGTHGEWEIYSSPSRDARLKTKFKELRDQIAYFADLYYQWDSRVVFSGSSLKRALLPVYEEEAAACTYTYTNSSGKPVTLSFQQISDRLFDLSFDPYHCIERRWGATERPEISSCKDGRKKRRWYEAQQNLRNQIDRTYDAFMGHSAEELLQPGGEGKGVAEAPDIDVKSLIESFHIRPVPPGPERESES